MKYSDNLLKNTYIGYSGDDSWQLGEYSSSGTIVRRERINVPTAEAIERRLWEYDELVKAHKLYEVDDRFDESGCIWYKYYGTEKERFYPKPSPPYELQNYSYSNGLFWSGIQSNIDAIFPIFSLSRWSALCNEDNSEAYILGYIPKHLGEFNYWGHSGNYSGIRYLISNQRIDGEYDLNNILETEVVEYTDRFIDHSGINFIYNYRERVGTNPSRFTEVPYAFRYESGLFRNGSYQLLFNPFSSGIYLIHDDEIVKNYRYDLFPSGEDELKHRLKFLWSSDTHRYFLIENTYQGFHEQHKISKKQFALPDLLSIPKDYANQPVIESTLAAGEGTRSNYIIYSGDPSYVVANHKTDYISKNNPIIRSEATLPFESFILFRSGYSYEDIIGTDFSISKRQENARINQPSSYEARYIPSERWMHPFNPGSRFVDSVISYSGAQLQGLIFRDWGGSTDINRSLWNLMGWFTSGIQYSGEDKIITSTITPVNIVQNVGFNEHYTQWYSGDLSVSAPSINGDPEIIISFDVSRKSNMSKEHVFTESIPIHILPLNLHSFVLQSGNVDIPLSNVIDIPEKIKKLEEENSWRVSGRDIILRTPEYMEMRSGLDESINNNIYFNDNGNLVHHSDFLKNINYSPRNIYGIDSGNVQRMQITLHNDYQLKNWVDSTYARLSLVYTTNDSLGWYDNEPLINSGAFIVNAGTPYQRTEYIAWLQLRPELNMSPAYRTFSEPFDIYWTNRLVRGWSDENAEYRIGWPEVYEMICSDNLKDSQLIGSFCFYSTYVADEFINVRTTPYQGIEYEPGHIIFYKGGKLKIPEGWSYRRDDYNTAEFHGTYYPKNQYNYNYNGYGSKFHGYIDLGFGGIFAMGIDSPDLYPSVYKTRDQIFEELDLITSFSPFNAPYATIESGHIQVIQDESLAYVYNYHGHWRSWALPTITSRLYKSEGSPSLVKEWSSLEISNFGTYTNTVTLKHWGYPPTVEIFGFGTGLDYSTFVDHYRAFDPSIGADREYYILAKDAGATSRMILSTYSNEAYESLEGSVAHMLEGTKTGTRFVLRKDGQFGLIKQDIKQKISFGSCFYSRKQTYLENDVFINYYNAIMEYDIQLSFEPVVRFEDYNKSGLTCSFSSNNVLPQYGPLGHVDIDVGSNDHRFGASSRASEKYSTKRYTSGDIDVSSYYSQNVQDKYISSARPCKLVYGYGTYKVRESIQKDLEEGNYTVIGEFNPQNYHMSVIGDTTSSRWPKEILTSSGTVDPDLYDLYMYSSGIFDINDILDKPVPSGKDILYFALIQDRTRAEFSEENYTIPKLYNITEFFLSETENTNYPYNIYSPRKIYRTMPEPTEEYPYIGGGSGYYHRYKYLGKIQYETNPFSINLPYEYRSTSPGWLNGHLAAWEGRTNEETRTQASDDLARIMYSSGLLNSGIVTKYYYAGEWIISEDNIIHIGEDESAYSDENIKELEKIHALQNSGLNINYHIYNGSYLTIVRQSGRNIINPRYEYPDFSTFNGENRDIFF